MRSPLYCIAALAVFGTFIAVDNTAAFELNNWRAPFAGTAQLFDSLSSSPSGMFWDNCEGRGLFGKGIWPDTALYNRDYWRLEPAVSASASSLRFIDDKPYYGHGGLTNELRYKSLLVRQRLDIDTRYGSDPDFIWKKDRGAAGRIEEAYIQFNGRYGFARLGRLARNWGPFADRSIILSDNPHGYDAFEWQVAGPFFEFRQLFSAFDYSHSFLDAGGRLTNRYLAAHSLNFFYSDWVGAGITETVLFGRQSGFPDLQYVNPVSVYTVVNTNAEGSGNLMVGFQGWGHPLTKDVTLKAQVLIDDIQVDNADSSDLEPNHWAGDFGIYWRTPLALANTVKLEYRYCSRWLYLVSAGNSLSGERYTYINRSLGSPLSDGDRWQAGFTLVGNNYWMGELGAACERRGGNTIASVWNTGSGYNGYRTETSLRSDSCELRIEASIAARGYVGGYLTIHAELVNRWIKNSGNIPSSSFTYEPQLSVSLSAQYPSFILNFPGLKP